MSMQVSEISEYLESNPELHNQYCIKGTKILARNIVKWLKDGRSVESIVSQLSKAKITEEDVEACWAWNIKRKQERDKQKQEVQARMKTLSENLRRIRKLNGLSQEILAYRLGVSRQWYWQIEAGTVEPTVSRLYDICRELDVKLEDVLGPVESKYRITEEGEVMAG